MGALFGLISLEAVKGAVVSLLQWIGRVIFRLLALAAVLLVLWPLLPTDPFRASILQAAYVVRDYAAWVNYFLDVPVLVGVFLFYAAWRYVYWTYRHIGGIVMDKDGQLSFDA